MNFENPLRKPDKTVDKAIGEISGKFFEASGRHDEYFEKIKIPFLHKVNGSMCAKFQVCIVVSVARRRDTNKYINK